MTIRPVVKRLVLPMLCLLLAGFVLAGCEDDQVLTAGRENAQSTVDMARSYVLEPVFSAARSQIQAKFNEYEMTGGSPSAWTFEQRDVNYSGYLVTMRGQCGHNASHAIITMTPDGMDPNKFTDKARFAQQYTICE